MASFPSYVKILLGATEKPDPIVLRSPMERGVPKQRRIASDTMVTVPVTLYYDTMADAMAFETWVFTQIGAGADWFNWTNPRTNTVVQARIVGGDIGALQSGDGAWRGFSTRRMNFEYLRSAY